MEKKDWLTLLSKQTQVTQVLETNQYTERYGLVLSVEDAEILEGERRDVLKQEQRIEFGQGILPKIIYAFCDSAYMMQEHYCDALIRLQEIFYLYKNEMLDEITDDELLEFMREQFDDVCCGDFDYLEGTCLDVFAQAIRAGYSGYQQSGGRKEFEKIDIVKRWDKELYLETLKELASGYSGYEHTSITYERAQMFMEAVLYCMNETKRADDHALLAKDISAKERYRAGQNLVIDKVKELRELYHELIIDFQDYGSVFLHDTIVKGIPAFLLRYDVKYAPQETLLTLDYPILKDLGTASGVDAVLDYVRCIGVEQKFLRQFDRGYVIEILRAYHDDYRELAENICHIVLQNMIGQIIRFF